MKSHQNSSPKENCFLWYPHKPTKTNAKVRKNRNQLILPIFYGMTFDCFFNIYMTSCRELVVQFPCRIELKCLEFVQFS